MIIWRLALRNLREHKTKTIIVGVLVAIAMTILVAGNSLIDSITTRLQGNYRETFTGDAVIYSTSDFPVSLFGIQGLDALNASVAALPDTEEALNLLEAAGATERTAIVQGQAQILHNEEQSGFANLWGIEPGSYLALFGDQIEVVEGSFFGDRERGIVLTDEVIDQIEDAAGYRYGVGDTITVVAQSQAGGNRIRRVPVTGVARYGAGTGLFNMAFVDIATARELTALDVETITIDDLSSDEADLLGAVSEDDLFGGGLFGSGSLLGDDATGDDGISGNTAGSTVGVLDLDNILGGPIVGEESSAFDSDRYHFAIGRAATPAAGQALVRSVTSSIAGNPGLSVGDWQWAAGQAVTLIVGLQVVFNVVALVISIVSIIIIVNTLVISISERIPEIGTIRAIGGKKRLVRKLISRETLVITGAFGAIGIVVGSLTIAIMALIGIRADTEFLQLLLGGEVFRPAVSLAAVGSSLVSVLLMGWIASLYPVRMATHVEPVVAMQRG